MTMATSLCLAHLSLIELTPPQLVEAAAAAGFDQVSMRLAPASTGEHQHPMIGGTPMLRETLARMRGLGVRVHDVELVRLTDDTDVAALEPLLACAAQLGARHILVAGDSTNEAATADRLGELGVLGNLYGLRMGLEFMPWRGIRDLPGARRVIELAGTGGIIIDAIHADRSGATASDLKDLPAPLWSYFQICDAPAQRPANLDELLFQARQARMVPGEGGLDLVGMIRALPAGTTISIEAPIQSPLPAVDRARKLRNATLALLRDHHVG